MLVIASMGWVGMEGVGESVMVRNGTVCVSGVCGDTVGTCVMLVIASMGWVGMEGVGENVMGRMGLFVLVVCVVTQLGHVCC